MPVSHLLLAVLVTVLWGWNFVAIKAGLDSLPPLLFTALRFVIAALPALWLPRPAGSWKWLLLAGGGIGVVQFGCLFTAMDGHISPGLASLVLQMQAFFTVLLARVIDGTKPRPWQWWGLALAFAGIALIGTDLDASVSAGGLMLILVAALGWASGNLALRRAGAVNMLHFVVWMSLVPPLPLALASLYFEGPGALSRAWTAIDPIGAAALGYIVVASTWIGYGVWGWLMQRHAVTLVAPFSLLVPLNGMMAAMLVYGEHYGPLRLVACALVLTGLTLNTFGGRLRWWRPALAS